MLEGVLIFNIVRVCYSSRLKIGVLDGKQGKADTRNWQTPPYSISYARIPLPEGSHQCKLKMQSKDNVVDQTINVDIRKGQTVFQSFRALQTYPAQDRMP